MQASTEDIVRLFWQLDHQLIGWVKKVADTPFAINTFLALEFINQDGPLPMKDISEIMEITPASISALVGKLESYGWVQRKPDEKDHRIALIFTTDSGRTALVDYYQLMGRFFEGKLTRDQQEQLVKLLQNLTSPDRHSTPVVE
jgi:DNA-binding MarR family transcriptional regulator